MNILIIDGAERRIHKGEGRLSSSLVVRWLDKLRENNHIELTTVSEGYNIQDERNKFMNADLVIFQFPVYWFSLPGLTKVYLDNVFDNHQLFGRSEAYGEGGKLKGKYIFSTTWNALDTDFKGGTKFFGDKSVDEVLFPVHRAFNYLGLEHIGSLHSHDVIAGTDIKKYQSDMDDLLFEIKNNLI